MTEESRRVKFCQKKKEEHHAVDQKTRKQDPGSLFRATGVGVGEGRQAR